MSEAVASSQRFCSRSQTISKNGAVVRQTKVFQDNKVTDHHALLPTENRPRYEKLSNEEQKIYQMIVTRFLGLFAEPHKVSQTKLLSFLTKKNLFSVKPSVTGRWKTVSQEEASKFDWQQGLRVNRILRSKRTVRTAKTADRSESFRSNGKI